MAGLSSASQMKRKQRLRPHTALLAGLTLGGVTLMKYRPNPAGLRELLRGSVAKRLVIDYGDKFAAQCGDGFVHSARQGKTRYRGIVYADTWSAKHRDHRENVMVRTLG